VVKQKTNGTCQFSWFCEHGLTITNRSVYNQIREMAAYMVVNYDKLEDVTDGATYYHADYVNPHWKLQRVSQIGRHIFYKRKGDEIDRNREFY
jgi:spore germination cell wall hydrolase CwlJ-like protein